MASLVEIERLAQDYSGARAILAVRVATLTDEIAAIKKRHLKGIRAGAEAAAEKKTALKDAIEEAKDLFEKPRTRIFHGIKVGIRKLIGAIEWEDDGQVIKLIKKHFPDQAEILIKTTERPVKAALNELTVGDLRKLGIEVAEDGDEIVIKATDSEIDRIVDAILKDDEIQK